MIINKTHVQGIFKYHPDIEFEKGDLVVQDGIIYICTASNPTNLDNFSVSGQNPSTNPENYTVYLGDRVTTAREYFEYTENGSGDDKYISSHVLSEILGSYMVGLNSKGIISEYVNYIDGSEKLSLGLSEMLKSTVSSGNNALDRILKETNLNHGIFRISRAMMEILSILPPVTNAPVGTSADDLASVILKQYTYIDTDNGSQKVRVQELIDHISGLVMYRYSIGPDYSSISAWKCSVTDIDFKEKVDYLRNYYITKTQEVTDSLAKMRGQFCFVPVNINAGRTVALQNTDTTAVGYLPLVFTEPRSLITINVRQHRGGGVYQNHTSTIDLSDSVGTSSIRQYIVDSLGTMRLTVNVINNGQIELTVSSGRISDIYYRSALK